MRGLCINEVFIKPNTDTKTIIEVILKPYSPNKFLASSDTGKDMFLRLSNPSTLQ